MNLLQKKNLLEVFEKSRAERIGKFLKTLLKHLESDQFGIVGGLAIHYWLSLNGLASEKKDWNDVDITVSELEDVPKTLQKDFLVYHYHPARDWYFHMAFVHKNTRIKCHVFPYRPSRKERFIKVPFADTHLNVVSPEEQLVKTVFDIASVSKSWHIDPKQFKDARQLEKISDMEIAQTYWQENNFSEHPDTIEKAITKAQKRRSEHPEWVHRRPYRKPADYVCSECQRDAGFTITPLKRVYEILEYDK